MIKKTGQTTLNKDNYDPEFSNNNVSLQTKTKKKLESKKFFSIEISSTRIPSTHSVLSDLKSNLHNNSFIENSHVSKSTTKKTILNEDLYNENILSSKILLTKPTSTSKSFWNKLPVEFELNSKMLNNFYSNKDSCTDEKKIRPNHF